MHTDSIKNYVEQTVQEIKSIYGWDTEVQVNIAPEVRDKHLFSVAISVHGLHDTIIVKKSGKQIMAVLRKVKKAVMRQMHRLSNKKISHRKKVILRDRERFQEHAA